MEKTYISSPRISLVFLLVAIISFLHVLSNYLTNSFPISLVILFNELFIILGIPILVLYFLKHDLKKIFLFKSPGLNLIIYAFILTSLAAILIDYTTSASETILPLPEKYHETLKALMAYNGSYEFLFKLFLLCFIPGFCEELFFRGICQTSIQIKWGNKKAILITAFLFALLHANPWYFHLYFILGFFLSWIYSITGNLWIPIFCHTLNNAWTFTFNSLEIELPIKGFTNPIDMLIITWCAVLLIITILIFKKKARPSEQI